MTSAARIGPAVRRLVSILSLTALVATGCTATDPLTTAPSASPPGSAPHLLRFDTADITDWLDQNRHQPVSLGK